MIEQPSGRLGNLPLVRPPRHRQRVRRERVEDRPALHIVGFADERIVHPVQRLPQRFASPLFRHRSPREILHQAVHDEAVAAGQCGDDFSAA